jgi:hypothetical protein
VVARIALMMMLVVMAIWFQETPTRTPATINCFRRVGGRDAIHSLMDLAAGRSAIEAGDSYPR